MDHLLLMMNNILTVTFTHNVTGASKKITTRRRRQILSI